MSARKSQVAQPKVDLDVTRDRLQRLELQHAAEALGDQVTAAVKDTVPPHRFLDQLLEVELGNREERRIRTSLRLSGLPTGQTLGDFDFTFQPSIERSRIETLGTCAWIRERLTLLIQGPPGVGKTHLAGALGVQAIENRYSVAPLKELLAALKRDADLPPAELRHRKYNSALVVIDKMDCEPMSRQEASLFFRLVSYRYGHGSILITINKGFRDWPEILAGDEVLATAILDRLLHHSHVLDIKGLGARRLWKTGPSSPGPQTPPAAGLTGHGRLPQTAPFHTPWKSRRFPTVRRLQRRRSREESRFTRQPFGPSRVPKRRTNSSRRRSPTRPAKPDSHHHTLVKIGAALARSTGCCLTRVAARRCGGVQAGRSKEILWVHFKRRSHRLPVPLARERREERPRGQRGFRSAAQDRRQDGPCLGDQGGRLGSSSRRWSRNTLLQWYSWAVRSRPSPSAGSPA